MITWKVAVMDRPANNHQPAQIPRSVVRMDGSSIPCVWPCLPISAPPVIMAVPVILIVVVFCFPGVVPKNHVLNDQEYLNSYLFTACPSAEDGCDHTGASAALPP